MSRSLACQHGGPVLRGEASQPARHGGLDDAAAESLRVSGRRAVAWFVLLATLLPASAAHAQLQPLPRQVFPQPVPEPVRPFAPRVRPNMRVHPGMVVGQAKINVAMETESFERARRYAQNGRYDLAAIVWQKILDSSNDMLATQDDWQYVTVSGATYHRYASLLDEIERTIAALPPNGLRAYRTEADPEAKALLDAAGPDQREEALGTVVRRFFLSSYGDDAALELACRSLDRYDFVRAFQLLTRLRDRYPDSNIAPEIIDIRLAAASGHVGDVAAGLDLLRPWKQAPRELSDRAIDLVEAELQRLHDGDSPLRDATSDRTMLLGTETRRGHMENISAETATSALSYLWFDDFYRDPPPNDKKKPATGVPQPFRRRVPGVFQNQRVRLPTAPNVQLTREQSWARWRQMQWRPSGQLLVDEGLVYFASHQQIMCRDIDTGKLQWMGRPTDYQPAGTYLYGRYRAAITPWNGTRPVAPREMQFFADRLARSMTICGDLLIAVEPLNVSQPTPNLGNIARIQSLAVQRANRLAAYNKRSGKLIWTCELDGDEAADDLQHFLAAPVPAAGRLVAPVFGKDAVWLTSIDPASGKKGWTSQLCLHPDGGRSAWSSAGIAVDGSSVYVATGAGAVAAVDARWGNIQWIATYPRGKNQNGQTLPDGCEEDIVVPHGALLVVMASDASEIFAVDRRTGQLRWSTARALQSDSAAVDYCMGVLGDYLYLAGSKTLRCYHIPGGRAVWEFGFDGSLGRGALTPDGIYIPLADTILRLEPSPEHRTVGQRQLDTLRLADSYDEPLGNLISDGTHLLGIGMSRVYKLGAKSDTTALRGSESGRGSGSGT